ncbi:MAG: insulinase family protein [Novosphingobium sp.]
MGALPAKPGNFAAQPGWAFEKSDLPVDPGYRFGRLANGMRYVVRRNTTPAGTAEVRMEVSAGSLDEREDERGFAHFVEHMAFNGSTHVPEGEMVKLLQREGLAFGADTNAETSFEHTLYKLNLPRVTPKLVDTALTLLRETASELTFAPPAVSRERGVVLSELRDGKGYALDNVKDQLAFLHPRATFPRRLPIGVPETLDKATAASLSAFWRREYVPAKTTVIVVGDLDPDATEADIKRHFDDWSAAPPAPRPSQGKVEPRRKGLTGAFTHPALSERVTVTRLGKWLYEPDTAAQRRTDLLRSLGYAIIDRRLTRLARQPKPPFRDAGFGTADVFHIGRSTNLVIDSPDNHALEGLTAAATALRKALAQGFTKAEVDEQLASTRQALEVSANRAETRSHAALVAGLLVLLRDDRVPVTPANALERFNAFAPQITPQAVFDAMRGEALPLDAPLIRFQGRKLPPGGTAALRAAWDKASHTRVDNTSLLVAGGVPAAGSPDAGFGYTSFGTPGTVVSDTVEPLYGIRELRFANGVRLNLRHTDLDHGSVLVRVGLDGGQMLDTRTDPIATEMMGVFAAGGLGLHSEDELETLLAGHTVSGGLGRSPEAFTQLAGTTPKDLPLELQLLAAYVTDPGYRPEGELRYRQNTANYFLRYRSTPDGALGHAQGGILSDDDPRFSFRKLADYQALDFTKLKGVIGDRLAKGAIEIGIVGDIDEAATISAVARTFGALPPREPEFRPYTDQRQRQFTARRGLQIIRHAGDPSQATIKLVWPTRDDKDPVETLTLDLLQEVMKNAVLESLREALGKSYSPGAQSAASSIYPGYGTFAIQASVDVADVPAARAALAKTVQALNDAPIDADTLLRSRAPMLERFDNQLKTNFGWLSLTERAQSKAQYLDRLKQAKARIAALTAADVQREARKFLIPGKAVELLVLPDNAVAPAK